MDNKDFFNQIDDREYRYVNSKTLAVGSMVFYDGDVYTIDKIYPDLGSTIIRCICHKTYGNDNFHILLNIIVTYNER